MPRYFCDYCDAYLTHDSAPGRQQHIRGWKHRDAFKLHYQKYFPQFMQQHQQQMQMAGIISVIFNAVFYLVYIFLLCTVYSFCLYCRLSDASNADAADGCLWTAATDAAPGNDATSSPGNALSPRSAANGTRRNDGDARPTRVPAAAILPAATHPEIEGLSPRISFILRLNRRLIFFFLL